MILLAATAIAGCGAGDPLARTHRDFVAGCTSSGANRPGCECLYQELARQGVNSEAKLKELADQERAAVSAGSLAAAPPALRNAVLACRAQFTSGR